MKKFFKSFALISAGFAVSIGAAFALTESKEIQIVKAEGEHSITWVVDDGYSSVSSNYLKEYFDLSNSTLPSSANNGETVNVTATLKDGWSLVSVYNEDHSIESNSLSFSFTMPDEDITLCFNLSTSWIQINYRYIGDEYVDPTVDLEAVAFNFAKCNLPRAINPDSSYVNAYVVFNAGYYIKGWSAESDDSVFVNYVNNKEEHSTGFYMNSSYYPTQNATFVLTLREKPTLTITDMTTQYHVGDTFVFDGKATLVYPSGRTIDVTNDPGLTISVAYNQSTFTQDFPYGCPVHFEFSNASIDKEFTYGASTSVYVTYLPFNVYVDADEGVTVTLKTEIPAERGARIDFTVENKTGYVFNEPTLTDADGESVTAIKSSYGKYYFYMPTSDVTIHATSNERHEIFLDFAEGTSTTMAAGRKLAVGTSVMFDITVSEGYIFDSLRVISASGNEISITEQAVGDKTYYTFYMPDEEVTIKTTAHQEFNIVWVHDNYCYVTVDSHTNLIAIPGDEVKFTVTYTHISSFHYPDILTVKDVSGNDISFTEIGNNSYSFIMPKSEVTIRAVTAQYYEVKKIQGEGSHINVHNGIAYLPGDKVTFDVTYDSEYLEDTVSVTTALGKPVTVTKNASTGYYEFTMPSIAVTISNNPVDPRLNISYKFYHYITHRELDSSVVLGSSKLLPDKVYAETSVNVNFTPTSDYFFMKFEVDGGKESEFDAQFANISDKSTEFTFTMTKTHDVNFSIYVLPFAEDAIQLFHIDGIQTYFEKGDEFTLGGTIGYTRYSGYYDMTEQGIATGYNMNELGEQTVTVTYTDQYDRVATYNYTITVVGHKFDLVKDEAPGTEIKFASSQAREGEKTIFSIELAEGYVLDSYSATDSSGNSVTITKVTDQETGAISYEFIMPESAVTIHTTSHSPLNEAKVAAKEIINTKYQELLDENEYSDANKALLKSTKDDALAAIDEATSIEQVNSIKDAAIQALEAIAVYIPSTGGCGGNIATTSILFSTLAVIGIMLILIKKRKLDK